MPEFLTKDEALATLRAWNVQLSANQMRKAATINDQGRRKLPFFKCPVSGVLLIEKQALAEAYHVPASASERI